MKTIYSGGYIPNLALQDDKDKPMFGWLCYKHPDGQWVSLSGEYKNLINQLTSARSRIEELEGVLRKVMTVIESEREEHLQALNHEAFQTPGVVEILDCKCPSCDVLTIARQALQGQFRGRDAIAEVLKERGA